MGIIEDVYGNELKKRFVEREFSVDDNGKLIVSVSRLDELMELCTGKDIDLTSPDRNRSTLKVVMLEDFYDLDPRYIEQSEKGDKAYLKVANGSDVFKDYVFIVEGGKVIESDYGSHMASRSTVPGTWGPDKRLYGCNANNDLVSGEYVIGNNETHGGLGVVSRVYYNYTMMDAKDTTVPSTNNVQSGLLLHSTASSSSDKWNWGVGCQLSNAFNRYYNNKKTTPAASGKYYLVDTKSSDGYKTLQEKGATYFSGR